MSNTIIKSIAQRGEQYGDFNDVATMSQQLKVITNSSNTYLSFRQREAVDMICVKLARICAGADPSYEDNWRDIASYAVLGGGLDDNRQ